MKWLGVWNWFHVPSWMKHGVHQACSRMRVTPQPKYERVHQIVHSAETFHGFLLGNLLKLHALNIFTLNWWLPIWRIMGNIYSKYMYRLAKWTTRWKSSERENSPSESADFKWGSLRLSCLIQHVQVIFLPIHRTCLSLQPDQNK